MTKILFFDDTVKSGYTWLADDRSARELMYLVNTGQLRVGEDGEDGEAGECGDRRSDRNQNAFSMPDSGMVVVAYSDAYVPLSEPMYRALFLLYDGKCLDAAAELMGMSPREMDALAAEMFRRFNARDMASMLSEAKLCGLV